MVKYFITLLFLISAHWVIAQVPNELNLLYGDTGVVEIDVDELDHLSTVDIYHSKLYFGGHTGYYDSIFHYDGIIGCLDSLGNLDTTFNNNGIFRFDFPGNNHTVVHDVVVGDSGVFFIGNSLNYGDVDTLNLFIGKLSLYGQLDTTFGDSGYFHPSINGTYDTGYELLLHNGKIVFCGSTTNNVTSLEHPLMGRLNFNGTPDTTFGNSGVLYWSWDGTLADGIVQHDVEEKHGAGGYLTHVTLVDSNYFFTGHYITSTNPMCLMIMISENGDIVPSYGGQGYRVFEIAPNFSNYVITTNYQDGNLYTLMDVRGTYDGEVFYYVQNTQGIEQNRSSFPLQNGMIHPNTMAVISDGNVAIAGYMKEEGTSSLISSDELIVVSMDMNGNYDQNYCNEGTFTHTMNSNESGVEELIYSGTSLFVAGNVKRQTIDNIYDFCFLKMDYNPTLKMVDKEKSQIKIYPNPASSILHIETNLISNYNIKIFDLSGKKINEISDRNLSSEIDVSKLKKGFYILQFSGGKGEFFTTSFIKK